MRHGSEEPVDVQLPPPIGLLVHQLCFLIIFLMRTGRQGSPHKRHVTCKARSGIHNGNIVSDQLAEPRLNLRRECVIHGLYFRDVAVKDTVLY